MPQQQPDLSHRHTSPPFEMDMRYAPYVIDGSHRPEGWGVNTKIFPFKSLLIYTDILTTSRGIQAAIREFFRVKLPCDYFRSDLFIVHLNGEVFYRPSTKSSSAVEMTVVTDVAGAGDFVELSCNGVVFGFLSAD